MTPHLPDDAWAYLLAFGCVAYFVASLLWVA